MIDQRQKALLEEMVEKRGRFGRKNGKGFYDYPQSGPKRLWPGLADLQADQARSGYDRCRRTKAPALGDPGAGDRALLRGGRGNRRAGSRRRLDPRLRLCAVHRRHHFLYRRHGRQSLRRAVQAAGEETMATGSSPASCCATWRRRATASTAASRRKRARPR